MTSTSLSLSFHTNSTNKKGFSLVEILIVLMILATLGTLVSRSISQAVKAKLKIQDQIDQSSRLRDATKLMERDIQLAFHHQDWEKELQDLVKKKSKATPASKSPNPAGRTGSQPAASLGEAMFAGQQAAGQAPGQATDEEKREVPRVDPVTHFVGSSDALDFVTMNQMHIARESLQADFLEVGYSLKECRSTDGKSSSNCLWRRSSKLVDADVTKGGDEMVLLENVSEFKLKYLGQGKQDWVEDWKTNSSQDLNVKNKFPWAVEISLTTEKKVDGKKSRKYSLQVVVPIHFPNNKEEKPAGAAENALGGAAPGGATTPGQPNPEEGK